MRLLPWIAMCALAGSGCAVYRHATATPDVVGRCLSVRDVEGAERLRLESELDPALRQFVGTHGAPSHLYVAERSHVYLFYVSGDMAASFARSFLSTSEVTKIEPIPGSLLTLLPASEQQRVLAGRAPRRAARPARRHASRPAPAAPAPATPSGVTLNQFPVSAIVERLSRPMSAADSGVSDWAHTATPQGGAGRAGRSGSTRYVVLPGEVSVLAPAAPGAVTPPAGLRVGYVRVNNAVFGPRADGVSRALEPLVARVAADPSGRTRVARRILGRTVRVSRHPAERLLVYAVSAD